MRLDDTSTVRSAALIPPSVRIGCSGWNYKTWRGSFYPRELPANRPVELKLWNYYTEFSIYSLLAMSMSGIYLWLASRPGLRWAQLSFAAGCGVFVVLYMVTR